MHISNRFVIVCSIQIVIRMLYHSFDTLLLFSFSYLMVKWGKSFVKIVSGFQIALLFLFYRNFQPTSPRARANSDPPLIWFYLMFQPSRLLGGPVYSGHKSTRLWNFSKISKHVKSLSVAKIRDMQDYVKSYERTQAKLLFKSEQTI